MRSRKLLLFAVLTLAMVCLPSQSHAMGIFSSLRARRSQGVPRADNQPSQSCEIPHPAVARIEVFGTILDKKKKRWVPGSYLGTAVLVYPGSDRESAVALTSLHVFRDVRGTMETVLTFPNGGKFGATVVVEDEDADWAAVILECPGIEAMPICLVDPKIGDRVFAAGYGSGCYRTVSGTIQEFNLTKDNAPDWLVMTGGVREGDSGGPITNSAGELVAITWANANSRVWANPRSRRMLGSPDLSVGTVNRRICQLLSGDFQLPWKRNRGENESDSDVEEIPPVRIVEEDPLLALVPDTPVPVVDDEARQMAHDLLVRLSDLDQRVEDRILSDAADRAAAREAILAAGQAVLNDGLTDETIDAASAAVKPGLVRWLEGMGVPVWVAVVVVGILLYLLVRWLKAKTADGRTVQPKPASEQVAAKTAWKGDNALARRKVKMGYGVELIEDIQKEEEADAKAELPPAQPSPASRPATAQELADHNAKIG